MKSHGAGVIIVFWLFAGSYCFADLGSQITSCVSGLPPTGGVCDFRGMGTGTASNTIVLSKPVTLLLDGVQLTLSGSPGIQISSPGVRIRGTVNSSQLIQGVVGNDVISGSSLSDFEVQGIAFIGQAGTVSASVNNGVFLSNTQSGQITRIRIVGNTFTGFRFHGIYIQNATDVEVADNVIWGVSGGIRFSGVVRGKIVNNVVRDTQLPNSTFTVAIGLDSTDKINNVTYPPCTDIQILNNTVKTYVNAQAILVHAGSRIAITGNILTDVLIGISLGPFNTTDTMQYVTVTGNVYNGTLTSGAASTTGNYGIFAGGGPVGSAYIPNHIVIADNTLTQADEAVQSESQGAIGIGYADDVIVTGNSIDNSIYNGIALTNPNNRILITNNTVTNLVSPINGIPTIGIYGVNGVQSGAISSNFVAFVNYAYRFDVSSPGLHSGLNDSVSVDLALYNAQNITQDIMQVRAPICTSVGSGTFDGCNQTINWPSPWTDTNYTVTCTTETTSIPVFMGPLGSKTTTSFQISVFKLNDGTGATTISGTIDCIGKHN